VLAVNLGGIANVTWIPPGFQPERSARSDGLKGFDTGPANMLMDGAMVKFSRGKTRYDRDGRTASRGQAEEALLRRLMAHPFIRRKPPKATGREDFGAPFLEDAVRMFLDARGRKAMRYPSPAFCDFMATLSAFTARSIGTQVKRFLPKLEEVVVCGGGSSNSVLMQGLRDEFPDADVVRADDRGIPAAAVEAVSFALLARAALIGVPANVPRITGARRRVVLGKITPGGNVPLRGATC
jgi:anhydro-N-acetylmuramic acid kinase